MASIPEAASQPAPGRVRLGHVWIDAVTFDEALERIAGLVRGRRGGSVFTPNVDHLVTAEDDQDFREAYQAASLSLADGKFVVWGARLLGTPVPAKISGSDLVEPLLRRAGQEGWRVFLLGGAPGVAEAAGERCRRDFGVELVGTASPYVRLDGAPGDLEQGLAAVVAARAQLVLVAMGAPKQERWIHHNRARLEGAVAVGVGASLDFIVGRVARAPRWVSNAGLEWLYRLSREPRRLAHRYLIKDPRFLGIILRTALRSRAARTAGRG